MWFVQFKKKKKETSSGPGHHADVFDSPATRRTQNTTKKTSNSCQTHSQNDATTNRHVASPPYTQKQVENIVA